MDDDDFDNALDEDFETLPCSLTYVVVCILLPFLNGQTNALIFPAYTIHFENNGWPVVRAGLAVTSAFIIRILCQQMTLRAGYWLAVPLAMLHLVFAVLGMVFLDQEWAVFGEIVVALGVDPTMAIEGLAFDSFGSSELQARQATSTCLSVFTMALALSCTVGGIIFDTAGWRGIGAYHTAIQSLLVLLLCLQPGCRRSLVEFLKPAAESEEDLVFQKVVPTGSAKVMPEEAAAKDTTVGAGDEELTLEDLEKTERSTEAAGARNTQQSAAARNSQQSAARNSEISRGSRRTLGRVSHVSRSSRITGGSGGTGSSGKTEITDNSGGTAHTRKTTFTRKTEATQRTNRTAGTFLTSLTRMTALSEAGQDFRHHFGTNNALQPVIAARNAVARDVLDEEEEEDLLVKKRQSRASRANIPKDTRFPCFLVVMTAFYNNASYVIEFATFAIFFRQVHNWNEATWASIAQTSGDLVAAISMQVIPALFPTSFDPDTAGCMKRFWLIITSPPYNLSLILATWILFNLGMLSPFLPLALVAQVFMGTTYVYSSKWTTDMNLFYSLGDSQVFMSLQVVTRNFEAVGGVVAGIGGTWLYSIDPMAPFIFCTGFAILAFLTYTVGFCWRLGYCDDIELAEQQRARRKGLRRVSSWASARVSEA